MLPPRHSDESQIVRCQQTPQHVVEDVDRVRRYPARVRMGGAPLRERAW